MLNVLYAVEVAVALGLIILVHELGHFLAAKRFGVRVRRFAIGMGPVIIKWGRGETEYSLRWIPVGGFVDLAGEHPEADEADDPKALWRRPAWQRTVIFSAGVIMNAILALVLFAAAPIVGIQVPVPVVGGVVGGMPAEKAGIQSGDRIASINGDPVESFEDVIWAVALSKAGTTFEVGLDRPAPGSDTPERLTKTVASARAPGSLAPMLGVEPELEPVIGQMHPDSLARQAGLDAGDRILAVNSRPVARWRDLVKALADAPAGPVTLTIERGGRRSDLKVNPADLRAYDYGMAWATEISAVDPDSPAFRAGIQPGDRIAALQDKPWPTSEIISETIRGLGAGAQVRLTLWRQRELVDVAAKTAMLPTGDHPRIGISLSPGLGPPALVGRVDAGAAADKAGLRPGDIIRRAGAPPQRIDDWTVLTEVFAAADAEPIPLQIERGSSVLTTALIPARVAQERLSLAGTVGTPLYAPLPRIYNPLVAAERGLKRTGMWLGRVYANIRQLATRQVSTKAVGGPVAIVQWSFGIAAHGTGTLMDFWGMLTISIAVLNFLPVPPFDGGHVLFVVLESVKGSPIGLKVRTWIWGAGWVGVGLLFVLIMWQDIARLLS